MDFEDGFRWLFFIDISPTFEKRIFFEISFLVAGPVIDICPILKQAVLLQIALPLPNPVIDVRPALKERVLLKVPFLAATLVINDCFVLIQGVLF